MSRRQNGEDESDRAATHGCRICGRTFRVLTNTHLRIHGLTTDAYRERYLGLLPRRERVSRLQRYLDARETIVAALSEVASYAAAAPHRRRRRPVTP